jgi:hypothetical protein
VSARSVFNAGADNPAQCIGYSGPREGEILAEQHRIDRAITKPLQSDRPKSHRRLHGVAEHHRRGAAQLDFKPLFEIVDGGGGDRQILRRADLAVVS